MMPTRNIFYVRLSSRDSIAMNNVNRTLDEGIPIEEISHLLSREQLNETRKYHPSKVFAWGSMPTEANHNIWSRMKNNDYFLVLIDRDIRYISKIIMKLRSRELAKMFWGETSSGKTWELIYLLTPPIKIYIPEEKIHEVTNNITAFSPRGLNKFSDDRIEKIRNRYGTIHNFITLLMHLSLHEQLIVQQIPMPQAQQTATSPPTHDELKEIIRDLGSLLDKVSETEVRIRGGSIDVAWKKMEGGSPHIVFEIHLAGNLHADLAKLKYARDIWNSIPVLVTNDEGRAQAENLLEGPFIDLKNAVRIIHWKDIIEMYNIVKKLKEKHRELGNIFFAKID